MQKFIQDFDKFIDTNVKNALNFSSISRGLIFLFAILYISKLAPELPPGVYRLFENSFFRLICFTLIIWLAKVSPSMSLLLALVFMVTINYSVKGKFWEMMENVQYQSMPLTRPQKQKIPIAIEEISVEGEKPPAEPVDLDDVAEGVFEKDQDELVESKPAETKNEEDPLQKIPESSSIEEQTGCLPRKEYDMTNVIGFDPSEDDQSAL